MADKPSWLQEYGEPWRRGESRVVFDNPWIRLIDCEATAPTGKPATYGLVQFKNYALAILPLHEDGTVTLVGQHRFAFGYTWEIPEGGGPMAEPALEGAKRELAEEAGLEAADWRQVLTLQLSNSVTDEVAIGYLAMNLRPAQHAHEADGTEAITIARAPFREVLAAAMDGYIQDSLTVAMLLKVYHMAREGLLPVALARHML